MKQIDYRKILELIQSRRPILCIDAREAFRHATLDAGGWKIPYNQIAQNAARLKPFKDYVTVVCCLRPQGSSRTKIAAAALRKLGFTDVRELAGGLYAGWILKVGRKVKLPAPSLTTRK